MKKYIIKPLIILFLMWGSAWYYDYTIDSDPIQIEWRLEQQSIKLKQEIEYDKLSLIIISNIIYFQETNLMEKLQEGN